MAKAKVTGRGTPKSKKSTKEFNNLSADVDALLTFIRTESPTEETDEAIMAKAMTTFPFGNLVNQPESLPEKTTDFTLFPNFPFEIRVLIWKSSMEEGRVVRLQRHHASFSNPKFSSKTPPPAQLSVCHESREEALKIYEVAFKAFSPPAKIYFNFAIDTIYFAGADDFPSILLNPKGTWSPMEDFNRIRHLAADICSVMLNYRMTFKSLAKLTLVSKPSKEPLMRKGCYRLVEFGPCPTSMCLDFAPKVVMGCLDVGTGRK